MKKRHVGAVSGVAIAALALSMAPSSAGAAPAAAGDREAAATSRSDNLPNPLADAQAKLRAEGVAKLLSGEATLEGSGASRVIKIPGSTAPGARGTAAGKARWVWYPVEREESIFTIDPRTTSTPRF